VPVTDEIKLRLSLEDQASEAARGAIDKLNRSTGSLTDFIRQQRTEQRQQNFLFRETAQSVTALSNTFVGPSGLTSALNSGWGQIQAVDFALAGLAQATAGFGGKLSSVLTTVAGMAIPIGAGVAAFNLLETAISDTEKASKRLDDQLRRMSIDLGETSKMDAYRDAQRRLSAKASEGMPQMPGWVGLLPEGSNARYLAEQSYYNKQKEYLLEIKQLQLEVKRLHDELAKEAGRGRQQAVPTTIVRKELEEVARLTSTAALNFSALATPAVPEAIAGVKAQVVEISGLDIWSSFKEEVPLVADTITWLGQYLQAEFSYAWESIFGEANSLFEKLMQDIASRLIPSLLGSVLRGVPVIGGFLGGLFSSPVRGQELAAISAAGSVRGGGMVVVNINSPVPDGAWVVGSIKRALRETGMTSDQLLVNRKGTLTL
jgi:hypothetical protein